MVNVVVAAAFGGPEVLTVVDRVVPDPGPGEVAIEVKAAGTNPADYKFYSGAVTTDPSALPMLLGMEVAGVVTAVGPDAQGMTGPLAVGDEVIAFPVSGGYAERVIAASANVIAKPADLPFEQAAGLLAAGTTAAHLMAATDVAAGDTVLIHGAGGGVGLFVTQLAVLKGARVIATASPRRHDSLRDYGAVPVEYGPGLSERVKAAAGGEVNIAMDLVGTDEAVEVSLELVSDPTRIATIAAFTKVEGTGIKLLGGGGPSAELGTEVRDSSRPELANLAGQGRLQVAVDRTFPLDQAADAHRHLQQGHTAGKVVLVP